MLPSGPFAVVVIGAIISATFSTSSAQTSTFTCLPLNATMMTAGNTNFLPFNSSTPVQIPTNFSCSYMFDVPIGAFLKASVRSSLTGSDSISIVDGQNFTRSISNTSNGADEFYAVSGQGQIMINSGEASDSSALIELQWFPFGNSGENEIKTVDPAGMGVFVDANDLLQRPTTFQNIAHGGKVAFAVSASSIGDSSFDDFFIFDGPDVSSSAVTRLSMVSGADAKTQFASSGTSATIVGLSNNVFYSDIIAIDAASIAKYDAYQGFTLALQAQVQTVQSTVSSLGKKSAFTVSAPKQDEMFLTGIDWAHLGDSEEACTVTAITGTPSIASRRVLEYKPETAADDSFPQHFPAGIISFEVIDCSAVFNFTRDKPSDYYTVQDGRNGYVFTPSYLDDSRPSTLNVSFHTSTNDSLTFLTSVESVQVVSNEQLSINVLDSNGKSAMSIVVTGNQTGGSADGYGTSANVVFSGGKSSGWAKVSYRVTMSAPAAKNWIILAAFVFFQKIF